MNLKHLKPNNLLKRITRQAAFLIAFGAFVLCVPLKIQAQKTELNQTQLWYAYFNNLKFNSKFRLLTDVQERQFVKPVGAQGTFLFRTILYRNLGNNWEAGVGVARFYQSPTKIPTASNMVVPEWRPTIDFVNKQKAGALNYGSRFRLEARYYHQVESGKLASGYQFGNFRFRYQFSADYPIIKNAQKKPVISLRAYDEVMVNFGSKIVANAFDQNRLYGGFIFNAGKNFTFELGYLNWFQETSDGKTYYNRNIFRLGINQTIDLSKKKTTSK